MDPTRILVVEDNAFVARNISEQLKLLGYDVVGVAGTGEEAVRMARQIRPDLVLMDILLPNELDGIAASERIQASSPIPIIYLTAYADAETLRRAKETAPYGYILKPFTAADLQSTIETVLYRHEMTQRLRESERRYRTLFDSVGDAIFVHDLEGRFLDVNRGACERLGYDRETLLSMCVTDIAVPELAVRAVERIAEIVKRGRLVFLTLVVARDRRAIPVEVSSTLIDYDGQRAVLNVARDITPRVRAEEHAQRLGEILDDSLSEIYVFDAETLRFVLVNRGARENLGYSMVELRRVTPLDVMPEYTPESFAALLEPLRRGERQEVILTTQHRRKDGSTYPVEVHLRHAALHDRSAFVAIVLDISERAQARAALAREQSLLNTLLDSVPDHIYFKDAKSRFTRISRAMGEAFGLSDPEQAVGKTDFDFFTEKHARQTYEDERRVMRTGEALVGIEEWKPWPDGRETWVSTTKVPLRDPDGNIVGTFGISRDITDRKRAEQALRAYSDDLEARVEARTRELRKAQERLARQEQLVLLGRMADGVAQELRNPLAVITNVAYLLRTALDGEDERVRDYLDMLSEETHNAERIISDLLDFARVGPTHPETTLVRPIVLGALARRPPPEKVSVTTDVAADLVAHVDPRQMEHVLGNLISNAYQAMPEGGTLAVRAGARDAEVEIAVSDTGGGIPDAVRARLFEPLFTTGRRGIGLGLATACNLVEANGGRIEVESEPGRGSTFIVILPARADPGPAQAVPAQSRGV